MPNCYEHLSLETPTFTALPPTTMAVSTKYEHDAEAADVVLFTADSIEGTTEFHVHKSILAVASPFFEDMFSLPQDLHMSPGPTTTLKQLPTPLPVIPLPEPADVLDTILQFIYPGPVPHVASFDELTVLLGVAIKYDIVTLIDALRALLVSPRFVTTDPIRAYAIACRFDLDEEARIASGWTLSVDILGDEDDSYAEKVTPTLPHPSLKYISAYDYHRLLTLHRRRAKAACKLLQISDDVKCMHCNGSAFTMHAPPKWWWEWTASVKKEMMKRPTTDKIFQVDWVFDSAKKAGCHGCVESVVHSWKWLLGLKESIDALPMAI